MHDDVIEAREVLQHSPERVWQVVGTPELYPRFVPEISWCERIDQPRRGIGPRCLIRICPRRGEVFEEQIDAVVHRPAELLVWSGVRHEHRWLSVELRTLGVDRTELTVQLRLPGLSAQHAGLISASSVRRGFREIVQLIDRYLSGRPMRPADRARVREDAKSSTLSTMNTLVRAGVISAGRPDKVARQFSLLSRWGASVAGESTAAAARAAGQLALHDERGARTYAQVDDRSNRLANALAAKGLRAADRVALMCRNHNAMVESMIACSKLGADVVLLNTGLSSQAVGQVIAEHEPAVVLADDEFTSVIESVPGDFLRVSSWPNAEQGYPTVDELIQGASDDARKPVDRPGRIVVLTSGTTGHPKGARRPTPKGPSTAAALLARIPLRTGDRILIAAPLFHTWGLAGLQIGLALRTPLSLVRKFDAEQILHTISEQQCNALFAVPVMLQRILDLPARVRGRYDLSSLRIVASSGSALPGPLVTAFLNTFGDKLYNLYGSTEVSWASIADPVDLRAAPTTAGRCPPGTQVAILDERGRHVPPGVEGQIFVGNEMLFEGYTDGGSLPRMRELMATGDVGYLDADGRLFVSGRADEMIVSGGENVFPRPVEEALAALPEVGDVAVVGVSDPEYGQRLAAYLVLRPGFQLDADDVRAYVHQRLARFAVPRDVYFVSALPRNATGKVVKRLLSEDTWPTLG
jgi:acyl-CoA synthetase (AMP-forming)/AMP-acid ligase II